MRNHVVLLSTRAGFERFLEQTDLSTPLSRAAAPNGTFAEQMCWGFVQEDGHVVVTNPDGALGEPLVAVNREPYDLRKLLAQENIGRRTIVTSDLNAVLRNPGLFEEFAERHSLLALVESRRREDVMPLQQKGWTVWEPAPWDILPDETPSPRTGLRGLDASVRASRREMKSVESWMPCKAPLVATLYQTFQDLSSAISQEALENDDVAATLQLLQGRVFQGHEPVRISVGGKHGAVLRSPGRLGAAPHRLSHGVRRRRGGQGQGTRRPPACVPGQRS